MFKRNHFQISRIRPVYAGNNSGNALKVVGVIGNHQRVVVGVGRNRVVGCDKWAQHRHQCSGRFIVQLKHLGYDRIAALVHCPSGVHFVVGLDLCIIFRQYAGYAATFNNRETLKSQSSQQRIFCVFGTQWLRRDQRNSAPHAWVHYKRLIGE